MQAKYNHIYIYQGKKAILFFLWFKFQETVLSALVFCPAALNNLKVTRKT